MSHRLAKNCCQPDISLLDLSNDELQYLLTLGSGMWCNGYRFVVHVVSLQATCVRLQTICAIFELRRLCNDDDSAHGVLYMAPPHQQPPAPHSIHRPHRPYGTHRRTFLARLGDRASGFAIALAPHRTAPPTSSYRHTRCGAWEDSSALLSERSWSMTFAS